MTPHSFWSELHHALQEGHPAFVALVADNTRGSPGTVGARLFVTPDGRRVGTIGGGIMEYRLLDDAKAALALSDYTPTCKTLWHRKDAPGEQSGMICAGRQTNVTFVCHPAKDLETVRRAAILSESGDSGCVHLSLQGVSVLDIAADLSEPAITLTGEGDDWEYREQLVNRKRFTIIGGGHCGLALSRTMSQLDYHVTLFDTRPDVDTLAPNTFAHRIETIDDYELAGAAIEYPETTRVVIMTTDYPSDVRALSGVLPHPFPFVGVMGSRTKIKRIKEDLSAQGFAGPLLESLYAPVGLPINSHTPEEIAISIAAQILQETPSA